MIGSTTPPSWRRFFMCGRRALLDCAFMILRPTFEAYPPWRRAKAASLFIGLDAGCGSAVQAGINITPQVDVAPVLQVILMATASGHGEAWGRRFTPSEAAPTNAPWPPLLEIGRSGQWWLEGVAADHAAVAIHLRTGAIVSLQTVPKVHAHGDAHYPAVVNALATAQMSGLLNVSPAPF